MDTTRQGSAAFGNPARVEMSLYRMLGNGLFQNDISPLFPFVFSVLL